MSWLIGLHTGIDEKALRIGLGDEIKREEGHFGAKALWVDNRPLAQLKRLWVKHEGDFGAATEGRAIFNLDLYGLRIHTHVDDFRIVAEIHVIQ